MRKEWIKRLSVIVFVLLLALAGCQSSDEDEDAGDSSVSVGSTAEPVSLTLGTAASSSVSSTTPSYYTFTTAASGVYTVTVTGGAKDIFFEFTTDNTFSSFPTSITCPNECTMNLAGLDGSLSYYVRVSVGSSPGTAYAVTVSKGVGEGSESDPVLLTLGTAHDAELGIQDAGASVYGITTTTSGGYVIETSNLDVNSQIAVTDVAANLEVGAFSQQVCSSAVQDQYCIYQLESNTDYLVKLYNHNTLDENDQVFTITASRGAGAGTLTDPAPLTFDVSTDTALFTGVSFYTNYYSVSDTTADLYYLWANNSTTSFTAHLMYPDGSFVSTFDCVSDLNQSCLMNNDPTTDSLTLRLMGGNGTTGTISDTRNFQFKFGRSVQDGTLTNPFDLQTATSHSGGIHLNRTGTSAAYYKFQAPGTSATLILTQVDDFDRQMTLYSDSGFTTPVPMSLTTNPLTAGGGGITETLSTVLTSGNTYYLKIAASGYSVGLVYGERPYFITIQ